jgi:DNA adenine methylase
MKDRLIAFAYYGGKNGNLDFRLNNFPDPNSYSIYVEPFCGSGAVILNKKPSEVEIMNDINGDITNFFRVLQKYPKELIRLLKLTPYSYNEYINCIELLDYTSDELNIERARKFYYRICSTYFGVYDMRSKGRWRRGYDDKNNLNKNYRKKIRGLFKISKRIKNIEILNQDALTLLGKYDSNNTFFYLDPPYVFNTRTALNAYKNELKDDVHIKMCNIIASMKSKVLISGYDNEIYNDILKNWNKVYNKKKKAGSTAGRNGVGSYRQEVLWMNYDVTARQMDLNL